MKKIIAIIAVLSMVFVASAPIGASAQTTAELQAQINSLLNVLNQLQARLSSLSGGSTTTTPSQSFQFTSNLTIGSRGAEVTQLQMFLVSRGYLVMPQGVAFGYFGTLTQRALGQFQAAQGISPTAGYFGSITRTRINSILAAQTPTTPTTPTTTPGTGITTPGVEGIMSVTTNNSGLRSSIFEGDQMVPVLGIKVQARMSDIAVQRVTIDLGNSSVLYNRILSKLYVTDGTNVLASADLNSSTVVREGNNYSVTITGFNYVVPKETDRTIVIKADARTSIDTQNQGSSFVIQLANNGVRGIDGAGIDHFAPQTGSTISRSITAQQGLAESARLSISLNSDTPRAQEIVASSGANENEADRVPVLVFNLRAQRDDVVIRDLTVNLSQSGSGTANASSTVYLYEGSTEIDNTSVSGGSAVFRDINYTVPRDSTKTLSIRTDIRNANSVISFITASIPSGGIVAENTLGDVISSSNVTGSASGYEIGFRNVGSEVTLVSKSIITNGVPQASDTTSILTATFNVRVRAVGSDIIMGTIGSTTPAFDTDSVGIYRNGVRDTTVATSSIAISYSVPSGANTAGLTNSFRVADGNEVTIPVTVQIRGRIGATAITSGLYAVGLENIKWFANNNLQTANFMAGNVDWRTNDVSFP